jgi:outer membrane lipoprotein-sorting protein
VADHATYGRMTRLTRRTALALGAAGLVLTRPGHGAAALPPAAAEAVAEIERYLDGLRTLRARFQQIAPDGALASGTVMLRRPGKLRFDYDPPSQVLVVATDWRLIFQDSSVKQINVIPLSQTPLGFLLAERIKLSGEVTVTDVIERGAEIAIRLIRTAEPDQGSITVVFGRWPTELRRWSVVDAQNLTTQIVLDRLEANVELPSDLFVWRDPQLFGWPGG